MGDIVCQNCDKGDFPMSEYPTLGVIGERTPIPKPPFLESNGEVGSAASAVAASKYMHSSVSKRFKYALKRNGTNLLRHRRTAFHFDQEYGEEETSYFSCFNLYKSSFNATLFTNQSLSVIF